jgi:Cu+-exporting ATPase
VFGGTLSVDGGFSVRLRCPAVESAAARIVEMVAAASRERSRAERAADRVAQFFLPLVIAIAAVAALWWTLHGDLDRGILTGLSVLVVACPCALGLATPLAVWLGLVAAARRGIVVRSAAALERAAAVTTVLFDKTGTLTERDPILRQVMVAPGSALGRDEILDLAAALESGLAHPLARSIEAAFRAARGAAARPPAVRDLRSVPGRGVSGVVNGASLCLGSPEWAAAEGIGGASGQPGGEEPGALLWREGRVLGALYFAERSRAEAAAALDRLRRDGVAVRLLSGDRTAAAVMPALLSAQEVEVGLLPEGKLRRVHELRGAAPGHRSLAVVGDGLNDAPALAAADFGIAFGDCADLTRGAADAVVLSADLERVPWLLEHARRVRRVVRQNLFWAFAYNGVAVVAAASGRLTPLLASLIMLFSSLAVVANARRLRGPREAAADSLGGRSHARLESAQVAGLAHDDQAVADLGADVGGRREDHLAARLLDRDHEHSQLLAKL